MTEHAIIRARVRGVTWDSISEHFFVPSISSDSYFAVCTKRYCPLTLYCSTLKGIALCHSISEELIWDARIRSWIVELKPEAGRELHVAELVRHFAKRLSDIRIVQGTPSCDLQLVGAALLNWGQDKDHSGFLGSIGMGSKSPFQVEFRLFCKIIGTFLITTGTSVEGVDGVMKSTKMIGALGALPHQHADYSHHKDTILHSVAFMENRQKGVPDMVDLVNYLVLNLPLIL
ncbi:hypothetical protein M427DRAFT_59402 [Gonapodya prolifera JEL478]|uniref:Uncharacterized protein n=1 Tax=Gonapodya prolifera (strain JEL478) TaxID=1344416 RepID=A0A139A778_GONPJ|nr:hypothetical protein M427DRAFT_59402 [Gonapodya prolifera JEL478]|eukprot:KXS12672.1 hypothetical protein M427DRAFT_59402 [Gonapodya prolifera JEL478]